MPPDVIAYDFVEENQDQSIALPQTATLWSAGYDARANIAGRVLEIRTQSNQPAKFRVPCDPITGWHYTLYPGVRALIPLGFRARMPQGMECQVRTRSGLAWKHGIVVCNTPGTIDADYPGEWMIMLRNESSEPFELAQGDRIAQLVFNRFAQPGWAEGLVMITTDRTSGFGSTGM